MNSEHLGVTHLKGAVKRKGLSCGEKWYVSRRAFPLASSVPLPEFHSVSNFLGPGLYCCTLNKKGAMVDTLFTIGYSGRSMADFIALLERHKITALCDVRSMPYSSRHPQFNRDLLKKAVKSHNIEGAS